MPRTSCVAPRPPIHFGKGARKALVGAGRGQGSRNKKTEAGRVAPVQDASCQDGAQVT